MKIRLESIIVLQPDGSRAEVEILVRLTKQEKKWTHDPIIVMTGKEGKYKGKYILIDGWHRVHAANALGMKSINAIVGSIKWLVRNVEFEFGQFIKAAINKGLLETEDWKEYKRLVREQEERDKY